MIQRIQVAGYRSVRELTVELGRINVLTGPNGCGKSNLYNSLVLIGRAAHGRFARAVAEEGGMPSLLWAGDERARFGGTRSSKRVLLGFDGEALSYRMQAGLPSQEVDASGPFHLDPDIKEESVHTLKGGSRMPLLRREGHAASVRNREGCLEPYPYAISSSESVLSQIIAGHLYPELSAVRNEVLGWRFYHHFRTDPESPMRQPQIGVRTPVLSADGADLAAALVTIQELGDGEALREAIAEALGGASLAVQANDAVFSVGLKVPGLVRPLRGRELSDGQLRFLCLCAALLSPRPAALLALNEPEASLHPDLIEPLAHLIARAAKDTQLWITTHSGLLAQAVERRSGAAPLRLHMVNGETLLQRRGD